MRCAICGQSIRSAVEPVVPTMSGDMVHIDCANRQARTAYRWRTCRAIISACLAIILIGWAACDDIGAIGLIVLIVVLIAGHMRFNWRWWCVTITLCRQPRR